MFGAIPPLPYTSSWYSASVSTGYVFMSSYQIYHSDYFTFPFFLQIFSLNISVK